MWFSSTIHFSLSVSEVSYNPLISNLFFFLLQLLHSYFLYVKSLLIDTFQHWLLYDKLNSNNNNNNHHYVSVIQVYVSELITCRILILYNAYITVLVLVNINADSVLWVDQQQLALYAHFSQTMVILALLSDNILFVWNCTTSTQIRTHQLSYINAILIQSQGVLISVSCINCHKCSMTLFLKCHCTSKHFSECCSNCKWHDHTAHCFVCNNDVLIVISDNKNNNSVNEGEHIARSRHIALTSLSAEVVVIDLNL